MRTLFGPIALVLALVATLIAAVPATATPVAGTSTAGHPMFTVPGTDSGQASKINNNNWIALNGSIPWFVFDPAISPYSRSGQSALVWRGGGSPLPVAAEYVLAEQKAHHSFAIRDINDLGEVVGDFVRLGSSIYPTAFSWNDSAGFSQFGTPGAGSKQVTGIDDSGLVTGWFSSPSSSSPCGRVLCSFVGAPGSISAITEDSFQAFDVDHGLVVGTKTWTSSGNTVALPPGAGGELGAGYEVNASGAIAGWLGQNPGTHAAYWPSPSSTPIDLGTLGTDTDSAATGINDKGWVVGWSGTPSSDPNRRAFIWKPETGIMEPLGTFPGGSSSEAHDINDNDIVVGEADARAVIWNVGSSVFNINYPPEVAPRVFVQTAAGTQLVHQPTITDPEGDPYTVTCSGLPTGAVCDPASGQLTWATTQSDIGTYTVSLTVTQDDEPLNNTVQLVSITVDEPSGPMLDPIPDQVATAGQLLSFAVTPPSDQSGALQPDYEVYSGQPGSLSPPPGNAFITDLGLFTWTPTEGEAGIHTLTIELSDAAVTPAGPPVFQTFDVTVDDGGSGPITIVVGESILVGDTVSVTTPVQIVVTESIGVSDEVTTGGPLFIQITESVGVADDIAVRPPVRITITETVGVSDDVNTAPSLLITITELVRVSDTVAVTPSVVITINESVGVSDVVVMTPGSLGSIAGVKWEDLDGDGTLDPGEGPLEGVDIYLDLDDDGSPDTGEPSTVTGTDGTFTFTDLTPGLWIVREIVPDGYTQTFPSAAQQGEHRVTITGSNAEVGIDFGNQPTPNLPPVIEPIDDIVVDVGEFVLITPVFSDPEGDALTHVWSGFPPSTAFVINGVIPYTPPLEEAGMTFIVTFTVTEVDNPANVAVETFSITVNALNQPASIAPLLDVFAVPGQQIVVTPVVTDPEGDPYEMAWQGGPPNAVINGIYILTPTADQAGDVYPITLSVLQNGEVAATQEFLIFVGGDSGPVHGVPTVNPPVADPGSTVAVAGAGFNPGSTVGVFLFSDPVLLGVADVGDDGSFSVEVTLPVGAGPGMHTIVVMGTASDGTARTLQKTIEISDDPDHDGLTNDEELLTGTSPTNSDSDGDGLIDGLDASWLLAYLDDVPLNQFDRGVHRARMKLTVFFAGIAVRLGDADAALEVTATLHRRIDGCGSAPDRNDWMTNCTSQVAFRDLLSLYERNVATLPLPGRFGRQ